MDKNYIIGVSGATGFIGTHLIRYLNECGYRTLNIGREHFSNITLLQQIVNKCDIIINLAGSPINKRWTKNYKNILYSSRIDTTSKLVFAINSSNNIKLFISTSAIGFYPCNNSCYDESFLEPANNFLGNLCRYWEDEAKKVNNNTRLAITRFGVVLSKDGGAFDKLSLPYKRGIGVTIGNANNFFSWICIEDLVRIMQYIIENESLNGIYNLTTPSPIRIKDLDNALCRYYNTKFSINIPAWIMKFIMGSSSSLLTNSICIKPSRLLEANYKYKIADIDKFTKYLDSII